MLSTYGETYQILNESQEGFREERCTTRQIQLIIATLEDAKYTKQDIYILYIDFKNAFGSIDHARLLIVMEDIGYPIDAISLIGNIYTDSTTSFLGTNFGTTQPINIQRGTIQGDTLSPYPFLIFLEPLLRWLQRDQLGYTFRTSENKVSAVAYTDDLATITNTIDNRKKKVTKLERFNT
jgi:hypothetical protein